MKILSAHPIDPSVKARIMEELTAIEQKHDVKVLFACESGSRGWGFASPDSDYDVRFLYVHRLEWYLRVEAPRDVIELPINDELDIGGWELRKALQLMRKSNPTLLEWLDSPIVYRQDEVATQRLRELAHTFFLPQRGRHHYLSMAKKNFRGYLQDETVRFKKYLYGLRPLVAVVRWRRSALPRPIPRVRLSLRTWPSLSALSSLLLYPRSPSPICASLHPQSHHMCLIGSRGERWSRCEIL